MDRLESMMAFAAAVEAGSLSAAARKLRVPLPTLSRRVAELEAHIGAQLLVRTRRGLSLTERGRAYASACANILGRIVEAERAAAGEYATPRGVLTVTAPSSFGRLHLAPVVIAFLKVYPEIDVRLLLTDSVLGFDDDHIDVAVRIGELPDSSLLSTKIGDARTVLCASPAYLDKYGAPQSLSDLERHECVNFEGVSAPGEWRFSANKREIVVRTHARLSVTTSEPAIDAALAGLGIARVYSYQAAEHIRAGKLKLILEDRAGPVVPVHLLRRNAPAALKLSAFVDFVAPRLRKLLDE